MRRIILKEARPGMQLARAVELPAGTAAREMPAVAAGAVLTIDHLVCLHESGVYDLWIQDPELDFLDDLESVVLSTPQHRLLDALRGSFQKLIALGINGNDPQKPLLKRYRLSLIEMTHAVLRAAPAVPCFTPLALQHEELLRHSADVCVLAMILGLQMEHYLVEQRPRLTCKQARDVLNLVVGCLFHDVGELLMPPTQQESRVDLSMPGAQCEGEEWKAHTSQGFTAVRTFIDPSAAAVVLHHHQHFDGTGFALSDAREMVQRGSGIHVFSRIAMTADVFHHVLHPAGAVQQPVVRTLARLHSRPLIDWFDPVALRSLCALIPPFVPGMVVTLSNRRLAIVRRVLNENSDKPGRPEVQILRGADRQRESDLLHEAGMSATDDAMDAHDLFIVEVDGSDVTDGGMGTRVAVMPLGGLKPGGELVVAR